MNDEYELVAGSDNPFADANIPEADTELMKADLAAEIIAILDRRRLTVRAAGELVGVAHSDVARIRSADLDRFTIDRLVRVLNALDRRVEVKIRKVSTRAA